MLLVILFEGDIQKASQNNINEALLNLGELYMRQDNKDKAFL